jgi:hypothetical protein
MIAINGAPASSPSSTAASEAAVRPDDSAELLTLWKSVFQNSRAVAADTRQDAPDTHQEQAAASNSMTEEGAERHGVPATLGGGSGDFPQSARRYSSAEVEAAPASRTTVAAAIVSGPASASRTASRSVSAKSAEVAESAPLASVEDVRVNTQAAAEEIEPSSEAASSQPSPQAASAETVSVFSQGTGIAIVVRDRSLSPEEALRSAFETAQQLTGRRSALGLLTLNGQVLYQQASSASQAPSSNPVWKMVC